MKSISACSPLIERLFEEIEKADAILVGAGSGLSTASGLTYSGPRFEKYFGDFKRKYGITDMYSGGFYPFATPEEYWAWWSRYIYVNRYDIKPGKPYFDLLALVEGKDYFVLTTNVDHQFQLAGFDKTRLFYTQGDYGLWQCSRPCHQKTYDNEETVRKMFHEQKDMRIPSYLVPRCPKCGAPLTMNLRCDETFVEDEGWRLAAARYLDFRKKHRKSHLLYLELGVGMNTPSIIKYPFWDGVMENKKAVYTSINVDKPFVPYEIASRSILLSEDIGTIFQELLVLKGRKRS